MDENVRELEWEESEELRLLNCYKTVAGGIYDETTIQRKGSDRRFDKTDWALSIFCISKAAFSPFWEISPSIFRADRGGGSPLSTQLFGRNLHSFKLLEQVRICSGISVQHSQASAAWICIHTLCIVHTFWVSFVSSLETLQQRRSCGIGLILLHFLEDKNRQILSTARLHIIVGGNNTESTVTSH